jgi:ribonuclease T2
MMISRWFVLVAALSAAPSLWAQGAQESALSQLRLSAPAGFTPAAAVGATAGPAAGQFDSYTFALSWQPAFCEGKPSAPECQSESPDRFDATNLALHGMWPNRNNDSQHTYGYCGIDAQTRRLDNAATWCQLPTPDLSEGTRSALTTVMPGVASCLEHHEWTRHGSCSGLAADDYFAEAAALVQQIARTNFGRYLTAHVGQTVDTADVTAAFAQDFGSDSRGLLTLNCSSVRGASALSEVRLQLAKNLPAGADLGSLLIPTGDNGNCGSSFLLDPVPSR